jgi:hypothetical protein
LTVSDLDRSVLFYRQALSFLNIDEFIDFKGEDGHPDLKGFGKGGSHFFWLKAGKPEPASVHVGFQAKSHAEVTPSLMLQSRPVAAKRLLRLLSCNIMRITMQPGYLILMDMISRSLTRPAKSTKRACIVAQYRAGQA